MRGEFLCAPGLKLEALERLTDLQFAAISDRLERMESLMERLERRLWLAVYGVVAAILAQAFQGILAAAP